MRATLANGKICYVEIPAIDIRRSIDFYEAVFGWPGIGLLAFQKALQYDYTAVMGITTFAAILVVAGNLLADLLYAVVDPRVRYT